MFRGSDGIVGAQLVVARCLVLMVGFKGRFAGGILSDLGKFHSIKARTVRSCIDAVAYAISKVSSAKLALASEARE